MRTRLSVAALAIAVAVTCAAAGARATANLPKPGTSAQVAGNVAASPSVTKLPRNLVPPLQDLAADQTGAYYGVAARECDSTKACAFGDTKSKTTIILFGDSHAQMWLPALVPVAQSAHDRIVLVWRPGCPAADVSVWDAATHSVDKACNSFRASMITAINKLKPAFVLIADRTSDIPGAGNILTSNSYWQGGEETTISELKGPDTKVGVIGDITVFTTDPPECLASNTGSVQACSTANPDPKTHTHFAAETAAASAEDVPYFNPQSWLCTPSTCSTVIANMAVYFDGFHVTATYAEYLSTVWAAQLKTFLAS
jgi:hypothetical protein